MSFVINWLTECVAEGTNAIGSGQMLPDVSCALALFFCPVCVQGEQAFGAGIRGGCRRDGA